MALATKTITIPIPTSITTLATNTRLDFSAVTVYIPETTTRTFRSVGIRVFVRDDETTSGKYVNSMIVGCKLGAAAFDDATLISSAFNQFSQFEHNGLSFLRSDAALLTYFNSNFGAGTSQTMQIGFKIQTCAVINVSAVVEITYEYDDATVTTVNAMAYFPLDGAAGNLTDTLTTLAASGNIPQLTGAGGQFDGLNSVVVRSAHLIITGNEAPTANTDYQLGVQLDSATEINDGVHRQNLQTATFYQYVIDVSGTVGAAAHTLKLRTTTTGRMNLASAVLVVQFEYNWSAGTVAWCSLRMPMRAEEGFGGSASSTDRSVLSLDFDVQDPATLVLCQSGVCLSFLGNYRANWTINCTIGSQTARSYSQSIGGVFSTTVGGNHHLTQRLDAGGVQGAGLTLARGTNALRVGVWTGTTDPRVGALSGIAYINYRCGKTTSEGCHTRTLFHGVLSSTLQSSSNLRNVTGVTPSIALTNYAVVGVGLEIIFQVYTGAGSIMTHVERLVGEEIGDGWVPAFTTIYALGTSGAICMNTFQCLCKVFNRWKSDVDTTRLVLTTARQWRFSTAQEESVFAANLYLTIHGITYTVADTVNGLAAPVAGNTVDIHLVAASDPTSPRIATTTTDGSGAFSAIVYDNTRPLFARVIQSSTHQGISYSGLAV